MVTTTPSAVMRRPANRCNRARVTASRLGECAASKRSWTAVATLVDVVSAGAAGADENLFDLVVVDRDAVGDPEHLPGTVSALDTDRRLKCSNLAREAREMRPLDHGRAVLVGLGRLFGDAAHRRALDDDAPLAEFVNDLAAAPLLQRLMPAQTPCSAVARGTIPNSTHDAIAIGPSILPLAQTSTTHCVTQAPSSRIPTWSAVKVAFLGSTAGLCRLRSTGSPQAAIQPVALDDGEGETAKHDPPNRHLVDHGIEPVEQQIGVIGRLTSHLDGLPGGDAGRGRPPRK